MRLVAEDIFKKLVNKYVPENCKKNALDWYECKKNNKPLPEYLLPHYVREYLMNANIPGDYYSIKDQGKFKKEMMNEYIQEYGKYLCSGKFNYNAKKEIFLYGDRKNKTFSACWLLRQWIANFRVAGFYYKALDFAKQLENRKDKYYQFMVIDDIDSVSLSTKQREKFNEFLFKRRNKNNYTIYISRVCDCSDYIGLDANRKINDKEFCTVINIDKNNDNTILTKEEENLWMDN